MNDTMEIVSCKQIVEFIFIAQIQLSKIWEQFEKELEKDEGKNLWFLKSQLKEEEKKKNKDRGFFFFFGLFIKDRR